MSADNDLERRLAEIEAREREVALREKAASAKGLRFNLYDRVNISPKALDLFIIGCLAAIIALVIVGSIIGNK